MTNPLTPEREAKIRVSFNHPHEGHEPCELAVNELICEIDRLRANEAAAVEAALERAAQINDAAAESFEPPMNPLDQIAATVLVEAARKIRSLSSTNALERVKLEARERCDEEWKQAINEIIVIEQHLNETETHNLPKKMGDYAINSLRQAKIRVITNRAQLAALDAGKEPK